MAECHIIMDSLWKCCSHLFVMGLKKYLALHVALSTNKHRLFYTLNTPKFAILKAINLNKP